MKLKTNTYTHMELVRDNEGELGECPMTRGKQPDSLLQERGEGICPLEADHDQVGPVELCEVEWATAVDGYTRSLGAMEALGPLVVARIPSVVVPVCVVVSASECVLKHAHSANEMACVSERRGEKETACVRETPCVDETPCVRKTTCVRERYEREMADGMWENATACPNVMARCVSIVARRSACAEWRWRRHQTKDKGRVAAVAVVGTAPGLHSSEREVRAVLRMRPTRARLRK